MKPFLYKIWGGFLALFFAFNLQAGSSYLPDQITPNDLFKSCMNNVKKDCETWATKGGGSEAPRGLTNETKAELAYGEKYILTGSIDITADEVYLRINLREQPWLASRSRVRNPYYRIDTDPARWRRYRGKTVTIVATARYSIWKESGREVVEIFLEPAADPILD